MTIQEIATFIKGRYIDPQYPFRDRLYFLFGTAGTVSAGAAFAAAIGSGLPQIAAIASLSSFFVMLFLMAVSFFMSNIEINRIICSVFLNFFMFPVLFLGHRRRQLWNDFLFYTGSKCCFTDFRRKMQSNHTDLGFNL